VQDSYRGLVELLEEYDIFYKLELQRATAKRKANFFQLPILRYIIDHPGCAQIEVSKKLLLSPASIALSTKRLQKEGFIEKAVDEESLRQNNLTATEKGVRLMESYEELRASVAAQAFSGFSERETAAFREFLLRARANLSEGRTAPLTPEEKTAISNQIKTK